MIFCPEMLLIWLYSCVEHHFKKSAVEMGIDFVGVGGYRSYLPFLRFAESLNIPWLILSDAEINVKTSVKKQFGDCGSLSSESDVIVFLDKNGFYRTEQFYNFRW
jgi:putative ATP-dependent endonuclease of OLD family